jgi:hypothetical protein
MIFLGGTLLEYGVIKPFSNHRILSCMVNITSSQQTMISFKTSGLGKARTCIKLSSEFPCEMNLIKRACKQVLHQSRITIPLKSLIELNLIGLEFELRIPRFIHLQISNHRRT